MDPQNLVKNVIQDLIRQTKTRTKKWLEMSKLKINSDADLTQIQM